MLTRVSRPGNGSSVTSASSSTNRVQPGQGVQQQSAVPSNAPAGQPALKQGEASGRPAPSRSNTASTTSAPIKHDTFIPTERLAKLTGEGDKRISRAAFIEDAFNKYKKAVEAERSARKLYEDNQKRIANDPYMCGQDVHRAAMVSAEYGTAWEKAAYSAATSYEAFKRAVTPTAAPVAAPVAN